jgi:hypothetical protein
MPITKVVTSGHICWKPKADEMSAHGYLNGTEWTCDECGKVFLLQTGGMAGMSWALAEPPVEPEPEPETPPE